MFVLIRQPKIVCVSVSSHSRGCMEIPANLMEFCGFGCFHCDFLEGKVDGPTKRTLQIPRRVAGTFQKKTFPFGLFFAAGMFTQDIESIVGQQAFGKLKSPKTFILASLTVV